MKVGKKASYTMKIMKIGHSMGLISQATLLGIRGGPSSLDASSITSVNMYNRMNHHGVYVYSYVLELYIDQSCVTL